MKYGLDRGKLLRFVVFILVWVVKKRSDCSKHGSLQFFGLSSILTALLSQYRKRKIVFCTSSVFSVNLTNTQPPPVWLECFFCVFTLLVILIEMGWSYEAQISLLTAKAQIRKKTGAKKISLDLSSVLKQVSSGFEYHIIHINKCTISEKCSLYNWIGYFRQHMQFGIFFSCSLPKNDNNASDITVKILLHI